MLISIYTSRVILEALGVSDYGIYNVVGGFVMMFSFLNSAMSVSVSRFLGIALGEDNPQEVVLVFKASINIHIVFALILAILVEVIGVWYMSNYINVPPDRLSVAFIVFHMSVLMLVLNVIRAPFIAAITINEDINAYAIITVIECVLKLVIVYALYLSEADRLMVYGGLMLFVTFIISLMFFIYSKYKYIWCKFQIFWDRDVYYRLLRFAGFNIFGNMVQMVVSQGQNLLLNLMFGPIVNAARGIAFQVDSALKGFVVNIFTAVNPQLFKSYGEKNYDYMKMLLYNSARLSFAFLLMISIPIILDIDYILNLWLVKVPQYTPNFAVLLLLNSLIYANIQPLMLSIHATARIGQLHIYTGLVNLLNIAISFIVLKKGCSPEWVFIVQIIVSIGIIAVTLWQMKRTLGFEILQYLHQVYCREALIVFLSFPIPFLYWFFTEVNFINLLILTIVSIISVCGVTIWVGIERDYRNHIVSLIKSKVHG